MWPTDTVLMIRPASFGYNAQTAVSNHFQQKPESDQQLNEKAQEEFDHYMMLLQHAGVKVLVFEDTMMPPKPDALFPNNWFSTMPDKQLHTFPMAVPNRAAERRTDILNTLIQKNKYQLNEQLLDFEPLNQYLEGTGSLVLDHHRREAWAAISPRTHETVLKAWQQMTGYELHVFKALDAIAEPIYHTNVMMCVGENFAVWCPQSVIEEDRDRIKNSLKKDSRVLIELSLNQTYQHFAGNMLQVRNENGDRFIVMSKAAKDSLNPDQKEQFKALGLTIIAPDLSTIERIGGGSARCMLAEIFEG